MKIVLLVLFLVYGYVIEAQGLREKVGSLFVVPACPELGDDHMEQVMGLIKREPVGGVIFMRGTREAQLEWIGRLQEVRPLLTFQDAEWGTGMRLPGVPLLPKNLTLGAIQDRELLVAYGEALAFQCIEAGIQGNFAPCIDLLSTPGNRVIGARSFGDDPDEVAWRGAAVVEGMQRGGVWACAKHFPGHGDTTTDSHHWLPCIDKAREQIEERELVPFRALIDGGVELVMVGHLLFPALDRAPSSLSEPVIQGLLRRDLGFSGVVVTDSLTMGALSKKGMFPDLAIEALLAGVDLVLAATDDIDTLNRLIDRDITSAIDRAMAEIPERMVDEKTERLKWKKREAMVLEEREDLPLELFRAAMTWVGEGSLLAPTEVLLSMGREDPALIALFAERCHVKVCSHDSLEWGEQMVYVLKRGEALPECVRAGAYVLVFDSPFALRYIPEDMTAVVAYEDAREAKRAAVEVLFGEIPPLGKLPVRVSRSHGTREGQTL